MNAGQNPVRPGKLCVGLTGGIASGKSAVASIFEELGAHVVDTDVIARDVVLPGQPGLAAVVDVFGEDILDATGALDRRALRQRVFSDPALRRQLESILHPLIRAELWRRVDASELPVQVLVIPLLVESGLQTTVDRVLVVDCPRPVQLERLLARDAESREQAERILDAQSSREARLAVADDVIDNSGNLDALEREVDTIYTRYLAQAQPADR